MNNKKRENHKLFELYYPFGALLFLDMVWVITMEKHSVTADTHQIPYPQKKPTSHSKSSNNRRIYYFLIWFLTIYSYYYKNDFS